MSEHKGNTNKVNKINLESSIDRIVWTSGTGCNGAKVGLEVNTHFVGSNSELKIEISDSTGKVFDTIKGKITGKTFWTEIVVPEKAKDELYAEVKLPKHGLSKKSNRMYVYPPPQIKNLKWDKNEARRGDILKLTADVQNTYEGAEAKILIFEHDADGAHDLITTFKTNVKNQKIELDWEYEYHEDTDDIPTEEETEKGYQWPEFFFRVDIGGFFADSGLLKFKDNIEIKVVDKENAPLANEKFTVILSNSEKIEGKIDSEGFIKLDNLPPGKIKIEFSELNKK